MNSNKLRFSNAGADCKALSSLSESDCELRQIAMNAAEINVLYNMLFECVGADDQNVRNKIRGRRREVGMSLLMKMKKKKKVNNAKIKQTIDRKMRAYTKKKG
eukprot:91513_1